MKKILFVAFAATLLAASCQKTEIVNPVGEPSMSFSTGMSKLTKTADAEKTGVVNLQEQHFRVWAYCAYEDDNTDAQELNNIYDGINNLAVEYTPAGDNTSGSWGTKKEYFWPGVQKELRFFAVSADPKSVGAELTTDKVVIPSDGTNSLTIKDFEVNFLSPNEDLMVADFVQQHQGDKVVDLNFRHALSKVQFVFKTVNTGDAIIYVQNLKVNGLETKGTLTVTPQNGTTGAETVAEGDETTTYAGTVTPVAFKWALPENPAESGTLKDFEDDWTTKVVTESGADGFDEDFPAKIDDRDVVESDKEAMKVTAHGTIESPAQVFTTWLMLPQSIKEKKVEITYLINERQFTSIFPLATDNLEKWEENQYIRYTITLAPNLISFNPSVTDWDTVKDVNHQN